MATGEFTFLTPKHWPSWICLPAIKKGKLEFPGCVCHSGCTCHAHVLNHHPRDFNTSSAHAASPMFSHADLVAPSSEAKSTSPPLDFSLLLFRVFLIVACCTTTWLFLLLLFYEIDSTHLEPHPWVIIFSLTASPCDLFIRNHWLGHSSMLICLNKWKKKASRWV